MELIAKYSLILLSIICIGGCIGNILSALVLMRKEMKSSTSYLLLGLTFFDGLLLLTYMFYCGIVLTVLYHPMLDYTYVIPDLLLPINKTAYTGSIYSTVLVTLDRYFAVCCPLHARSYLTKRKSKYSILGVFIFSIAINLPRWLEYYVPIHDPDNLLYPEQLLVFSERYVLYYHGWIWTIVMYVIPIFIIGILNFRIWKVVSESNANYHHHHHDVRSTGRPENSLTKMLLTLVTVFFILNLLNCIVIFSLRYFLDIEPFEMEIFACFPLILNSSINFIIYCVMGQHFRTEFYKMCHESLLCSLIPKRNNSNHLVYTTAGGASAYYINTNTIHTTTTTTTTTNHDTTNHSIQYS